MIDLSPVVVSGLGTVNAAGCGRAPLQAALRDAATHWTAVDRSAGHHRRRGGARLAGMATAADLSPWLSPRAARRMSWPSKLAVAATAMALEDAGLVLRGSGRDPGTAVVVSNAFGPTLLIEQILGQAFGDGPLAVSPALFMESVANAPAAQVAMASGAMGPNLTVTQREAGSVLALAQGAAEIAQRRAERALVVAVDELPPILHAVLDSFQALAHRTAGGPEAARPFDRRRNGFIAAEGATALVLEREEAVRARGARVLARMRSSASAFDPHAPTTGWSDRPERLAPALERHLAAAGLDPDDLGVIVSCAAGGVAGDRLEAGILKAVWGRRPLPPVLTPKAYIGEHGGALLAASVLALEGAAFGPTPGFSEPDPALGVEPHDGRPLEPAERLLATALAAGGAAGWVVLERGDGG